MEKPKICYGPTKHLLPYHSAKLLPTHAPFPHQLPRRVKQLARVCPRLCSDTACPRHHRELRALWFQTLHPLGCKLGLSQPALLSQDLDTPGSQPQGFLFTYSQVCWKERAEHISALYLLPFLFSCLSQQKLPGIPLSFSPAPAILL